MVCQSEDQNISDIKTVNNSSHNGSTSHRKQFTWQELAEHNRRENVYVAIRGKVYDLRQFVSRHPGGVEQILYGAGRDCTQLFESYHSAEVAKLLPKFYVGDLISNELPVFPEPSEFHKTVKERVNKFFKDNNIHPKYSWEMFTIYTIVIAAILGSYYSMLWLFPSSLPMIVILAAIHGFFGAMSELTLLHDSSHFAVTKRPFVWSTILFFNCWINGNAGAVWVYQHVLGHHPYTNIDGADPDILTSDDPADIRRIKDSQNWISRYFYQHIYAPLLYGFLCLKTRLQDFRIVLWDKKNGEIRLNPMSPLQFYSFWIGKLAFCIKYVLMPLYFMPFYHVIIMNVVADAIMSYWLALTFQASHVVSEVEWPLPDKDKKIHQDWAELQIATTQDYATDSFFWNVFTGHLNHQTAHHLFPGVIQYHFPKITPIVERTCKEFGLKYHYQRTFTEGLGCHINHLKRLGQDDIEVKKAQ